jgi:hypothetical protein
MGNSPCGNFSRCSPFSSTEHFIITLSTTKINFSTCYIVSNILQLRQFKILWHNLSNHSCLMILLYASFCSTIYLNASLFLSCHYLSSLHLFPFNLAPTRLFHFVPLFPFVYPPTLLLNRSRCSPLPYRPSALRRAYHHHTTVGS